VVRFFYRMVLEVYQVFWAGMAAGEFINTRRGRNLKGRCLTLTQREEIALGRARGESIRAIAASIGRSPSTVSRELRRNADGLGRYRATSAHALAYHRASRLGLPDGPCCCLCLVSPAALARGSSPTRARSRPPAPSQARHR
jgi:Helix-turn-helix domain